MTAKFLATYTHVEGVAEDIGFSYLRTVPTAVIEPLLARQPWSGHQIADMLTAVVKREDPIFRVTDHVWFRAKFSCDFDLVTEWRWANKVRNDLAHSAGQWVYDGSTPSGFIDIWELHPRSNRYKLQKLPPRFDVEFLFQQCIRLGSLNTALIEVAAHLGIMSLNGYQGPGPKPFVIEKP